MRFVDEYRDRALVLKLAENIRSISRRKIALMEVCGGHTMSIQRFGIPALLPPTISLLSGPGCPVCVSSRRYIDLAIALSRIPGVIITTYGDLIRVPGSSTSLDKEKSKGADIRIVYSPMDALAVAQKNPTAEIVFLGIGFETTAPASAAAIIGAERYGLSNFYLLSTHKIMPPAMAALIDEGVKIDGYIAPGHVSAITGTSIYTDVAERYRLGCVIAGFEPVDLMESILMLVRQIEESSQRIEIQYKRAVPAEGNPQARKLMDQVFELRDEWWRGLGILPLSGLKLKNQYSRYNAEKVFGVEPEPTKEDKGCICGEILKGLKTPKECKLFGTACTPVNPAGPCMVSNEGACHAFFRYNR